MRVVQWLVLPSVFISSICALGWNTCDDGGVCPEGNKCCGISKCISGRDATKGSCCDDDVTGCGEGFTCSGDNTCFRIDPADYSLPERIPRYRLCTVAKSDLQVHGFSMTKDDDSTQKVAYLSTAGSLDTLNSKGIETAWIVIHGSLRDPDDYICCASTTLELQGISNSTLVIAPWFLAPQDRVQDGEYLRWEEKGPIPFTWRYGANAINSNASSYAVVDQLIEALITLPDLKRIVVAGHSAGGQYVQRWAMLSRQSALEVVPIRIVVANPKSFCYLDDRRMLNGTLCKPHADDIHTCPSYNEWQWGLDNSSHHVHGPLISPYKDEAVEAAGGVDRIVELYPTRSIVYLGGELDVLANGDCEARLQGRFRHERSRFFYDAIQELYGYPVHKRLVVKEVHHDHCLMFQSPEGREALFGPWDRVAVETQ